VFENSEYLAQSVDPIQVEVHGLSRYSAYADIPFYPNIPDQIEYATQLAEPTQYENYPQSRYAAEQDFSTHPKISTPSDYSGRSVEPYKVEIRTQSELSTHQRNLFNHVNSAQSEVKNEDSTVHYVTEIKSKRSKYLKKRIPRKAFEHERKKY